MFRLVRHGGFVVEGEPLSEDGELSECRWSTQRCRYQMREKMRRKAKMQKQSY